MKTKITQIAMATLICLTAILFNGCKGKDGATGAAGTNGNANVHSMTFTLNSGNWNLSGSSYYTDLSCPLVTTDIINNGAVLVYTNSATTSAQLPVTYYPSSTYAETMMFVASSGSVQLQVFDSDLTAPSNPGAGTIKVVTMTSRMLLTNPHINFKNYDDVKKAFKLKD